MLEKTGHKRDERNNVYGGWRGRRGVEELHQGKTWWP